MANNTTKKKTTPRPSVDETVVQKDEVKPIIPKDVDPNQIIVVRNGFNGSLVYISPRTHERFKWECFGDEQEVELRELRNAKSSAKKFFENNWFMFNEDDAWVIDYLGLKQFYKNAISLDDFDEVLKKSSSELESIISKLPSGQKRSIAYRARQMVANGEIDSHKSIAALEKVLGVELIER